MIFLSAFFLPNYKQTIILLGCSIIMLCISFLLWPVDRLIVLTPNEQPVFVKMAPLGYSFQTSMIHSVQRTPVEDTYKIIDNTIWNWQEKVQSHNAGLPSVALEYGATYYDFPWMIIQGGRFKHDVIYYRVGSDVFGFNKICLNGNCDFEYNWISLYKSFPHFRLQMSVITLPLYKSH